MDQSLNDQLEQAHADVDEIELGISIAKHDHAKLIMTLELGLIAAKMKYVALALGEDAE